MQVEAQERINSLTRLERFTKTRKALAKDTAANLKHDWEEVSRILLMF